MSDADILIVGCNHVTDDCSPDDGSQPMRGVVASGHRRLSILAHSWTRGPPRPPPRPAQRRKPVQLSVAIISTKTGPQPAFLQIFTCC